MTRRADPRPSILDELEALAADGDGADLGEFYEATAEGDDTEDPQYLCRGRNVWWNGTEGHMMKVPARDLVPIEGNIFYPEKLAAVAQAVRRARRPLVFDAPYGHPSLIDRDRIQESIQYARDGDPLVPVYSTGDEDLDEYLLDPKDTLGKFGKPGSKRYEKAKAEREEAIEDARRRGLGDFGRLGVQVRDGNHRAFGAVLGGESHVWILLDNNAWQDFHDTHSPGSEWREAWRAAIRKILVG